MKLLMSLVTQTGDRSKDSNAGHTRNRLTAKTFGAFLTHRLPQTPQNTCRETGCWFVGGDDLTAALHDLQLQLSPPPPSSSTSNKTQNGDVLVPASPDPPGKRMFKTKSCQRESVKDKILIANDLRLPKTF